MNFAFRTEQLREYLVSAMAKDMSVLVGRAARALGGRVRAPPLARDAPVTRRTAGAAQHQHQCWCALRSVPQSRLDRDADAY